MLFLVVVFLLFNEVLCKRELAFVQAVWRHGDRAPLGRPYPSDRYGEGSWPRGYGQLTNIGMQQLKAVGGLFKDRYAGSFVDARFNHKQVYIRSSDSDRALVSAQSILNGFFPPNADDKFEPSLNWQPIAVHSTTPGQQDPAKYRKVFDFLTKKAGYNSPITVDEVATLNDINREIAHGLNQPDWVYKRWPEFDNNRTLDIISEIGRILRTSEFSDLTLAYLRGGFLLNDWMRRAERVAAQNQTDPTKMLLYSSHDGTLLALMNLLKVADGQQIPYGGVFLMETYKENNDYFVEFYYWTNNKLTGVCLEGCCTAKCSVKKFIYLFGDHAIKSVEELDVMCSLSSAQIQRLRRIKHKHHGK